MPSVRGPSDGFGDSVAAADYNRDGRVDLLVTNGAEGGCRGIDVLALSANLRVVSPDGTADCVEIPAGNTSAVTKGASPRG
jgi:hypothetical protein